ncbi:MAG: DUF4263 domain-containing protein [Tildeniella torsiva UHER 1998/13D]|jgi:hypothetical protein|nr:DUF4263 domain-containing protein [Tildeniella torsiva UHER 1998/13D]
MSSLKKEIVNFLPKESQILVAVKPDSELPENLSRHIISNVDFYRSKNSYISFSGKFIPLNLKENLQITFSVSSSRKIHKKLKQCKCSSPAIPGEVFSSLNIALSKISQTYEKTTRKTPGGRVYSYLLFQDELDKIWKPLEILRERLYLPLAPHLEPLSWSAPLASESSSTVKDLLTIYDNSLKVFAERLNHKYLETSGDQPWQTWIQENFWLFGSNYRQPVPKEKVGFNSIPDFLFVTLDGFLDFLEIKLPQHPVIIASKSHSGAYRWSAEANEAIGQSIQYLSEIEKNQYQIADNIQQKYMLTLSTIKPRALILVGSSNGWSFQERTALRKLNSSLNSIEVITYTDLLERGQWLLKIFRDGL